MIESFIADWTIPLTMTIIHSFWHGLVIVILLFLLTRTRLIKNANQMYFAFLGGLILLMSGFVTTLSYFNASLSSGELISVTALEFTTSYRKNSSSPYTAIPSIEVIIALLWLCGTLFFLLKSATNVMSFHRILKTSMKSSIEWQRRFDQLKSRVKISGDVQLRISPISYVPMVIGILKPVIVFPLTFFNQMTLEELESILIHELIHVNRKDFLINVIQRVVESFLFFNPATWWISRQISLYREYSCDDLVQQNLTDKKSYMSALYKAASNYAEFNNTSVALFNNKSELVMRIQRMISKNRKEYIFQPVTSIILLLVMVFTLFAFQNYSSSKSDPNPTESTQTISDFGDEEMVTPTNINQEMNKPKLDIAYSDNEYASKQSKIDNDRSYKSNEKLHHSIKTKESYIPIETIQDTIPPSPRIQELEKKLEAKTKEIDAIAKKMEAEIQLKVETDVRKMEALVKEMEEKIRPKMEALEKDMQGEEMKRMEVIQAEIESKMESKMASVEKMMNEGKMVELEKSLESLSRDMEKLHKENSAEKNQKSIQETQKKMQEVQHQMQKEMEQFQVAHNEIMNNPDIKKLQQEMEVLSKKIQEKHRAHDEIWTEETKALQSQIENYQVEIEKKVSSLNQGYSKQIEALSREIQLIAEELEKEKNISKQKK